jgi:hypothetical protein
MKCSMFQASPDTLSTSGNEQIIASIGYIYVRAARADDQLQAGQIIGYLFCLYSPPLKPMFPCSYMSTANTLSLCSGRGEALIAGHFASSYPNWSPPCRRFTHKIPNRSAPLHHFLTFCLLNFSSLDLDLLRDKVCLAACTTSCRTITTASNSGSRSLQSLPEHMNNPIRDHDPSFGDPRLRWPIYNQGV